MAGLFVLLIVVGGYGAFAYGDESLKRTCEAMFYGAIGLLVVRYLWIQLRDYVKVGVHRARVERLQAFASELQKGALDARGFYSGSSSSVSGKLDGRDLEAHFRLGGEQPWASFNMKLKEGSIEFDALRAGFVERVLRGVPFVAAWRGEPHGALRAPLEHLLLQRGLHRVTVSAGWLRAEAPLADSDLRLEHLLDVSRTLAHVARIAEPKDGAGARNLAEGEVIAPRQRVESTSKEARWTSSSRARPRS